MRNRNYARKTLLVGIAALGVSMAASACGMRGVQEAEDAPDLSYFLVGCDSYDDEGSAKTSMRFLIRDNEDGGNWYKQASGTEKLSYKGGSVDVYSEYINDDYRYVSATVDGSFEASDFAYEAVGTSNKDWEAAGEDVYEDIGAIFHDGGLYFYNGAGYSVGLSGSRSVCTWLAGFTPADAQRSGISTTDGFRLLDADGNAFPEIEGAEGGFHMSPNEFGIEIYADAADPDTVKYWVDVYGMVLAHTDENGTETRLVVEERLKDAADVIAAGGVKAPDAEAPDAEAAESGEAKAAEPETVADEAAKAGAETKAPESGQAGTENGKAGQEAPESEAKEADKQ